MNTVSLGDMAQSFMLQRRNGLLKHDIGRLTEELATGRVADVRQVLAGNFSYLTDIERSMDVLRGFSVATSEATHFSSGMQTALEQISDAGRDLSEALLVAGTTSVGTTNPDTARKARTTLDSFVGVLNTRIAGRNLFSGTATDTPPLPSSDTILNELRLAIAGAATANDMITAAQAWFDDPLGYASVVYQGATDDLAPFSLSDTESVALDIRADDVELRDTIRLAALAALADDPAFALSDGEQTALFFSTGAELIASQDQITSARARVGFAESQIDRVTARNAAEMTSMEFARNELLAADPYDTATQLENAQFQLQSLYSVTVRMSQLSLVNFL